MRRTRRGVKEYSAELPDGVGLEWLPQRSLYRLYRRAGRTVLAQRREDVVLRWKNPERVFAYIVRRISRGPS